MVEGLFRTGGAERDDFELVTNGRKHELFKKQAIIRIVCKYFDSDGPIDVFDHVFDDVFDGVFSDRLDEYLYLVL